MNNSGGTQTYQAANFDPFKVSLADFAREYSAQFYRLQGFCGNENSQHHTIPLGAYGMGAPVPPATMYGLTPHFD